MNAGDWFYKNFNGGSGTHEAAVPPTAFPQNPQIDLPTPAQHLKFRAATQTLEFSFNGKDVHGSVAVADGLVSFDGTYKNKIWLRTAAGGNGQVYAWHGPQ